MGSRFEFLEKKYLETGLISGEALFEIIVTDPTSVFDISNGSLRKVGKYTQWILKLYEENVIKLGMRRERFFEDLYKISDDLRIFHAIKNRKGLIPAEKKDINQIHDAYELYELVKKFAEEDVTLSKAEVKVKILKEDVSLLFDGKRWDVISPESREAAIAVSGPPLTRWCTASESGSYFDGYHRQGRLYIIRNKGKIIESGRAVGQPTPIWQFHFETNSFMDVDDRRVDIVHILSQIDEIKIFFKSILKKYFLSSKMTELRYPDDNASMFIKLYGFEDYINHLPEDITDLDIDCAASPVNFKIPKSIKRFTKLMTLYLGSCVEELPEEIGELKSLQILSVCNNPKLKSMPESISDIPELLALNVRGSNCKIPERLKELEKIKKIMISK